jgi:flagellar motor switch protein FliN/FliY
MAGPDDIPLPDLKGGAPGADLDYDPARANQVGSGSEGGVSKVAEDLEHVFDVPVNVSAVLGRTRLEIGELLRLGPGTVLELDRKVGEAIDIFVNDRLVARGEVVLVDERLGVTMTEIIKADR